MNPIMRKSGLTPDQLMRRQLYSLLDKQDLDLKSVNIIGNNLKTDDDSELVKIIKENGFTLREVPRTKTYDEYKEMGKAFLNITYNPAAIEAGRYLEKKLGVPAHGILSFDLKEDKNGEMKVTEINIRHMAYAGVMAHVGFDLIEDTIRIMEDGNCNTVVRDQYHHYDKPYIFLRDVDVEPIILESEEIFDDPKAYFNIK